MKRYIILPLIIIIVIIFIVFAYFYNIWSDEDQIKKQIIDKAYREVSILKSIDEIDYFSGDKQFYFIFGKNKAGFTVLVWLNDVEIHYRYLFDWVTKDQITVKTLNILPDVLIKRISAGINEKNKLIYEVLFEDSDGRLGYQYFYLENGEYIKTYLLGKLR